MQLKDERINVRLKLRRTPQGWLLRKPLPVYLSRQEGVRVLAETLAEFARNNSDAWSSGFSLHRISAA